MAPVLTSLTPDTGPKAGLNPVVITGSGFSGVGSLTVRFGATATTFTIDSDTQITAIAPAGTGAVNVTVTANLDGTSNPLPYTYGSVLFVTDGLNPGTVYSVPAAGGVPTVLATGLNKPRGLAVSGNTVFIADSGNNRVVSMPTPGGPITPFVTGLSSPDTVAVSGNTLYIAEEGNNSVVSVPIGHMRFPPNGGQGGLCAVRQPREVTSRNCRGFASR
ncbi:IPT/TIG domain-containing protein, partial [Nocardia sp. NPDC059091]|uniref:IPT/TIG domain-containing protein n=1 Tax=unclassified Nocardia TaxID=2637762 RepID=UPI0036BEF9BE